MRIRSRSLPIVPFAFISLFACSEADSQQLNQLTRQQVNDGWENLFDGETLEHWRGFKREDVPRAWSVADSALHFDPNAEDGGDIITRDSYQNFELSLEWRIMAGGNSGIFFGVTEDEEQTYHTGPEMQVLDNAGHVDGQNPLTSAGSDYALHAPSADVTRPLGEWNEVRILVDGNQVEQWLNGVKVVEYERWNDEWKSLVANSKFVQWPRYGLNVEGHIGLQDHGNPVWFRNIRVRRLAPTP